MEGKGLRFSMGKPMSLYLVRDSMCFRSPAEIPMPCVSGVSAQMPFSVVIVIVGSTEMKCYTWVHKRWSVISGHLKPDPNSRCKRCTGQARPVDGSSMAKVTVGRESWGGAILLLHTGLLPQVDVLNSLQSHDCLVIFTEQSLYHITVYRGLDYLLEDEKQWICHNPVFVN